MVSTADQDINVQLSFHNVELDVERKLLNSYIQASYRPVRGRSTLKDGVVQWVHISKKVVLWTQNSRKIDNLAKVLLHM